MSKKSHLSAAAFNLRLPDPPPHTPVPEDHVQRFEQREPVVPRATPAASRLRRNKLGERVAVYMPPELVAQLRHRSVAERRSVSDAVTEAVSEWMKDHRPKGT